eukprot:3325771-Pyramimonas_sp.AAC.1
MPPKSPPLVGNLLAMGPKSISWFRRTALEAEPDKARGSWVTGSMVTSPAPPRTPPGGERKKGRILLDHPTRTRTSGILP